MGLNLQKLLEAASVGDLNAELLQDLVRWASEGAYGGVVKIANADAKWLEAQGLWCYQHSDGTWAVEWGDQ